MKNLRYIVVDDDSTNNMICDFTIKRFDKDAERQLFSIPEEALDSIKEEYSSTKEALTTILFLDINMPTMTGWEFLDFFIKFDERIKDQFSIYILSSSIEDLTEKAKTYTFIQGFLSKPLKTDNLEEIRKELLQSQL